MNTYQAYYLVSGQVIVAGPFPTVYAAVSGKKKFVPPYQMLLSIVKSTIQAEEV